VAASNGLNLNFRACSGATVANVASSQLSALGPGTNNVLPGRLSTLYGSIRAKSPNARVTVVGYPRIFMGEDCNAFTWFSPAEESRLNATADLLNSRTSAQANARGFAYANPTSVFIGHAVCDYPEWINGLSDPISDS
jgi:hypothetical protein